MLQPLKRKYFIDLTGPGDVSVAYIKSLMDDARVTTLQQVANVSHDMLHWQYKEGWNTIGALLAHVAAIEHFFRIEYVMGRKLTGEENERWLPALDMGEHLPRLITGEPLEHYVEMLAESRAMMLDALETLTFEDLVKRREGYDPDEGCNLAWVLYHMVEDEVHHRGQISIVKKLYKDRVVNN